MPHCQCNQGRSHQRQFYPRFFTSTTPLPSSKVGWAGAVSNCSTATSQSQSMNSETPGLRRSMVSNPIVALNPRQWVTAVDFRRGVEDTCHRLTGWQLVQTVPIRNHTRTLKRHTSGSESPVAIYGPAQVPLALQTRFRGPAGVQNASVRFETPIAPISSTFEPFEVVVLDTGQRGLGSGRRKHLDLTIRTRKIRGSVADPFSNRPEVLSITCRNTGKNTDCHSMDGPYRLVNVWESRAESKFDIGLPATAGPVERMCRRLLGSIPRSPSPSFA